MAKSKTRAFSRPPWERMMRFHNLLRENSFPNCTQLAEEFEVSQRTIMRDVDFMRDRLMLPIEFDSHKNGYYYTEPVNQFPQMPFSKAEIFALLVAHKAVAQYRGTPFEQLLALAFKRLTGQLDTSAKYLLTNLDEALSFRLFGPEDNDLETFEILTRALKERRVLKFQYRNLDADKAQVRLVHPYHRGCVDTRCQNRTEERKLKENFYGPRFKRPRRSSHIRLPKENDNGRRA